jgi:hypothetical protein
MLLDKVQKALGETSDAKQIGDGINRYVDMTREGEAFVKEASSSTNAKYLRDRYSIDISKVGEIKLASSLMAFASAKDLGKLKKFGFSRKEVVEVLSFVDSRMNGTPIDRSVVDYVAKTAGDPGAKYYLGFMTSAARPLSLREKSTMSKWAGMLREWNV